jgi:endo-1,4-beta-D-glucanase Y
MKAYHIAVCLLPTLLSASAANFPFPQSQVNFGIKTSSATSGDVQSVFDQWIRDYYEENGTEARIKWDDKSKTVSEGIGYGMLVMPCMDNAQNNTRDKFDKLWNYYKRWRNSNGLMHWKINGFTSVEGQNAATDGDLDAAVGLILAYRQWGDEKYRSDATELVRKIWDKEVNSAKFLKPGDTWDTKKNPSYFSTAALELFKTVDSHEWSTVISNSYALLKKVANASTGLVPDWCSQDGNTLEGDFYYDAVRTPWRIAWAYAWYGHGDARDFNTKIATWLRSATGGNPTAIKGGYSRSGNALNNDFVATFAGCLSCAAMASADNQDFVDRGFTATKSADASNYYNKSLQMITMLTLSGNLTPMTGSAVEVPRILRAAAFNTPKTFIISVCPFAGRGYSLNGRGFKGTGAAPQVVIPKP